MERLNDYDAYKDLLSRNKSLYRRGFNNNYLSVDKIKQYIRLGRMSFIEDSSGIQLFLDEKDYYRCILMISAETVLHMSRQDKPVFVRNIYDITKKSETLTSVEESLKKNSFKKIDTSVQIMCKPKDHEDEYRKNNEKCLKFLSRFGIHIDYPDASLAEKVFELRKTTPELKYYQFPYEEIDDIIFDYTKGYYRCAFNAENELIGAQHFTIENETIQGDWLAIKDEYRVKYGVGRAMAYHAFVYALDNRYDVYYGWVVDTNYDSLKYHSGIGYVITNKRANEWILE